MRAMVLWIVLAAAAAAADVTLTPPAGPIESREYVQVLVTGLSDRDLAGARVEWSPRDGTTLIPARLWGGQPFLWFSARQGGKYTIAITVHGWRQTLDQTVGEMAAAGVDDVAAGRLREIAQDLATRFPTAKATCVLEVAGGPPPLDPPNPGKPPPATTNQTPTRATYVYEKDSHSVPRPVASALRKLNSRGGVVASEFEQNTVTGTGQVPTQYRAALEAARKAGLPALVIESATQVLRVVKDPQTEQDVEDSLK